MNLQELFKDARAVKAGMWMARLTPRWFGYSVANYTGSKIAENRSGVFPQVRENLSHIPGTNSDPGKLDQLAKQVLINAAKSYYDFYHVIGQSPSNIVKNVNIPQRMFEVIEQYQSDGHGVQIAGIHMSNFDLGSISLSALGLNIQGLSAAQPNGGYQFQNEIRRKYGFITTPIDTKTLREAVINLKNCGIIASGLDWPQHDETNLTEVFGKPAYVPLGTARLAMLTNAVTIVIAFYKDSRPGYQMYMSEPMEVIRTGNREEEIRLNTRQYYEFFEKIVSRHPDQWIMYHKFWAD